MNKIKLNRVQFKSRILKVFWGGLLCFIFISSTSIAQNNDISEYQVKAVFLYNFTQFIEWPATAFKSMQETFVIGIIGDDPFGDYIDEAVAGENVGAHPIVVKRIYNIKDVEDCHLIFVRSNDPNWVKKALGVAANKNILTVGDQPEFIDWGGMIRFFIDNKKIKFEINVNRSKDAQLNVSSKLLSVAKVNQ